MFNHPVPPVPIGQKRSTGRLWRDTREYSQANLLLIHMDEKLLTTSSFACTFVNSYRTGELHRHPRVVVV